MRARGGSGGAACFARAQPHAHTHRMPEKKKNTPRTNTPTPHHPHHQSGDIFQLVLSQRFERRTFATPFEVYRALRVVNPSPYMVYMQVRV